MNDTNLKHLDFQDPGPLPKALTDVPGFVNALKEHTLRVSPRPNEPLAFAGALAMMSHLGGRTYCDQRGGHTNLYLVALAPSGMGKESPRTVNKQLALSAGFLDAVPDSLASGQALEDAVAAHPALLLQNDEADTLFSAMRGSGTQAARLSEMVLRFFGETNSAHAIRQFAGDGTVRNILQPHLTLFATGIPRFVYEALSVRSLENGLLGRCLFLENESFAAAGNPVSAPVPDDLIVTARFFHEREKIIEETGVITPEVVPETPEATQKITELLAQSDCYTQRLMAHELPTAAAVMARLPEKVFKLALIWALSENPARPCITADGVIWSTKFVSHLTQRLLYQTQFYVAEGKFDRLKKRTLGIIAKNGGQIDRSTLLRKLHIDSRTLKNIILTLHMSEMLEEEQINSKRVVYTLKQCA